MPVRLSIEICRPVNAKAPKQVQAHYNITQNPIPTIRKEVHFAIPTCPAPPIKSGAFVAVGPSTATELVVKVTNPVGVPVEPGRYCPFEVAVGAGPSVTICCCGTVG